MGTIPCAAGHAHMGPGVAATQLRDSGHAWGVCEPRTGSPNTCRQMARHHRRQDGRVGQRPRKSASWLGLHFQCSAKAEVLGEPFQYSKRLPEHLAVCNRWGTFGPISKFSSIESQPLPVSPPSPLSPFLPFSFLFPISVTSSLCLPLSFSPLLSFPSFLPPVCHLFSVSPLSSILLSPLSSHSVSVTLFFLFSQSVICHPLSIILSLFFHVSVISSLSSHCLCHSPLFFLFSQVSLTLSLFLTPPFPTFPGILFQVGQMPTVKNAHTK